MAKDTTQTPMQRLFDRLRQKKKETENKIAQLQDDLEGLQRLEGELMECHLELEPVLNFYAEEFSRAEEAEEPPEEPIEEQQQPQRHKLPDAICLQFTDPGMRLTVREIATFLEDMRQRGELDTKSEEITRERTSRVVRELTKENRLVRETTKAGNRTLYVYRLA